MSYSDDLAAFINAVVEEKAKELQARKSGKPVPGGMGSSLGGVIGESDGIDGGEEGDDSNEGMEKLTDRLKPGDKPEKFKLFDCETGEEVTLDGIGGNGAKPIYPTGFEDCEGGEVEDGFVDGVYWYARTVASNNGVVASDISGSFQTQRRANTFCLSNPNLPADVKSRLSSGVFNGQSAGCTTSDCDGRNYFVQVSRRICSENPDPVCYLPPPKNNWPAVDKNHLVWNDEKQCLEPLCGDLNTQVSGKYLGCNDEMILCDEEGNKVKVEIDGDEMKVTQSKFNQEAIIKNGKVQSTKSLTAEQTARAFK